MDYIQVNGYNIPYPNGFTMEKVLNITNEATAMDGTYIADYNGWKYADQTFTWDTLTEANLQTLIAQTNPLNGTFNFTFVDAEDGSKTIDALRTSRVLTKTRFKEDGKIKWKDISLSVKFPRCYSWQA